MRFLSPLLLSTALGCVATRAAPSLPFTSSDPVVAVLRSVIEDPAFTWPIEDLMDDLVGSLKPVQDEKTIADLIEEDSRLSSFAQVVKEQGRGVGDDLDNRDRKQTVFAFTNEAWEKFEKDHNHNDEDHDHDHGNEHNRHHGRCGRRHRHGKDRENIGALLRYHLVRDEELKLEAIYDGQLIETVLRLDSLDGEREKIRVFKFREGDVLLNMQARIIDEKPAENGILLVIDRVLETPLDIETTLAVIPTEFSSTLVAIYRSGLHRYVNEGRAVTLFAPTNDAWTHLGYQNLFHLFSDAGKKDLKKIMSYHLADELVYSPRLIEEKSVKVKTEHEDKELKIDATKREQSDSESFRNSVEDGWISALRRDGDENDPSDREPKNWVISINDGQATVQFTDGIASNGVLQVISSVLIPDDVDLPNERGP
ncbi:FAS1 domain-containing protein [Cladochytrium replicatum]|nr:FAS1 domain-containing protein [Cladochytrium replicatum]